MIVGHFSDLHGHLNWLDPVLNARGLPDVWVCSGDFFPNQTRGVVGAEVRYQTRWFGYKLQSLLRRLGGKPVIWCPGNHDFVSLARLLSAQGYPAHDLMHGPVDLADHRFVGLREIPWLEGEWAGEVRDLGPATARALAQDPTLLVAHCPPAGVLDLCGDDGDPGARIGNPALSTALSSGLHRIRWVLSGHVHEQGGRQQVVGREDQRVVVVNSATTLQFVEV